MLIHIIKQVNKHLSCKNLSKKEAMSDALAEVKPTTTLFFNFKK